MANSYVDPNRVLEVVYSDDTTLHLAEIWQGIQAGKIYRFVDGTVITATTVEGIEEQIFTWERQNRTNSVRSFFQPQMQDASDSRKRKLIFDLKEYLAELEASLISTSA